MKPFSLLFLLPNAPSELRTAWIFWGGFFGGLEVTFPRFPFPNGRAWLGAAAQAHALAAAEEKLAALPLTTSLPSPARAVPEHRGRGERLCCLLHGWAATELCCSSSCSSSCSTQGAGRGLGVVLQPPRGCTFLLPASRGRDAQGLCKGRSSRTAGKGLKGLG